MASDALQRAQARRILVVDDEEEPRRIFSQFLSLRGFQPVTAGSSVDALAKVRAVRPSLALVDIVMPKMDGIQLLKFLRSDPATVAMPVILMTGLSAPESFMEAAAEGLKAGPIYAKGQSLFNLESRIESELRRGGLVVDLRTRQVRVDGREVKVAGHRFDILCHQMYFDTNGSTRMSIDHNGNVGIGTTTPAFKLDTNSFSRTSTQCNSATSCTNTCAAGLQIITGGCGAGTASQYITGSYPASLTVWNCFSSAATTLTAYTICGSMN